jgi:hypothetical protein
MTTALSTATCRSCGASILWVRTERGNRMPMDATPVPEGTRHTYVLRDVTSPWGPLAIAAASDELPGEVYYGSHFATCPNAAQHRR